MRVVVSRRGRSKRLRRRGWRLAAWWVVTVGVWVLVLAVAGATLAVRWPVGWFGERFWWWCAVGGSFVVWFGVACAAVGLLALGLRRWGGGAVCALGAVVALSAVLSVPRAGWRSGGEGVRLRVMQVNVFTFAVDDAALVELVASSDVDVVSLLEVTPRTIRALREDERVVARLGHVFAPRWTPAGLYAVLSAHPISGAAGGALPETAAELGVYELDVDGVAVGFSGLHPWSPRTPERAARGDAAVVRAVARYREAFVERGVPMVVAADLNGTAVSGRGRALAGLGLRPSKPLLRLGGTWPQSAPAWRRASIDDVWCGPGVRAVGWEVVGVPGSDHAGVIVDVVIETE